ncbi:hypothetical protein E2C01_073029 [Portunus trituberculatus]|uniref:Uncharacterized protein n=1 Tax=Portunus trituberculatus TaxID=210409 RepID=A0A5B7HZP3_PORTR|nr:hypothetical protein [Portunus trituberculatus]
MTINTQVCRAHRNTRSPHKTPSLPCIMCAVRERPRETAPPYTALHQPAPWSAMEKLTSHSAQLNFRDH